MTQKKNWDPEILEIVANMTLMDDEFLKVVFEDNIKDTQLVLGIILERDDLTVLSVKGQSELQGLLPTGRSIKLDILAVDSQGKHYNIEVQRKRSGATPRRVRYHSAMLDARLLDAGQDFDELVDSYVIFITERDYFERGLPLYHVHRKVEELAQDFEDGSHIIYVNGQYTEDDPIGWLMQDFKCKEPSRMNYEGLAKSVGHYKEEEERSEGMCDAVEAYAEKRAAKASAIAREEALHEGLKAGIKEGREEALMLAVKRLVSAGNMSLQQAMSILEIPESKYEDCVKACKL